MVHTLITAVDLQFAELRRVSATRILQAFGFLVQSLV